MRLIKFMVGTRIWLVPDYLVTADFISAVDKLNNTKIGEALEWTDKEAADFKTVDTDFLVAKPY